MKTTPPLLLALLAAGCAQPEKLQLATPPSIDNFTATPATVMKGAMVTLAWTTRDGDVEVIDVGHGPVAGIDRNAHEGSVMVRVDAQSLFVLNVTNARGVKVTAIATVAVEGLGQQIMLAALPSQVAPGGTSTLVWSAPGAHAVSLTPMGGTAIDLHGQVQNGSVEVSPAASTKYTLTADGTSKSIDVTVTQAVISFAASKSLAPPGEMVTLSWRTANATKVTLSQPGKGVLVTETDPAKVADGSVTDTLAAYPNGSIVPYQLTVEGAGAKLIRTVNVVIGTEPVIATFASSPLYAKVGGRFTLSWTTMNADAIEISTGGLVFYRSVNAVEAVAGSLLLDAPSTSTDYTLAAVNTRAGVRVTRVLTQQVVGTPTVTTFTALPVTVAGGGDPVTLTWNVPSARHLRIVDSDGVTVVTAHGPAAESGSRTAYPNGPTTYTLTADNTLDFPGVTATAMVTVTTPAAFGAPGTLFAGDPFNVTWTVGGNAGLQGYANPAVAAQASSTGFVDITTTGTKLPFSQTTDDSTQNFTPDDFETFLWGTRLEGPFRVSSNGWLVLGPTSVSSRFTAVAFPNATIEPNFLAPFWADLAFGPDTGIYWQVLNEAPERTLVVQFNHMHGSSVTAADLTFEVKVHQTGIVTFEYQTLANLGALNPGVGVQGPPNTGISGPGATAGGSLTFFGPTPSPAAVTLTAPNEVSGFIKLTSGYLHVRFMPAAFVRPNEVGITEVLYSPNPAIAATGEWFEVSNRSNATVDLAGWGVDFPQGTLVIDAGVPLAPGARALFGQIERDAGNDDVATAYVYGTQLALSDDAGTLSLSHGGYRSTATWNAATGATGGVGVSLAYDTQPHLQSTDTSTTPPHPFGCSSRTPFGMQTPQQRGTPGGSTICIAAMTSIPVSYFDISATGTPLFTSFDTSTSAVSFAGAPFPYQGANITVGSVSTNGFVTLKANSSSATTNNTYPGQAGPSGSLLAPFWDDLDRNSTLAGSNGYFKRVAPNEDSNNPGGHWIVQWHHYSHFVAGDDLNIQVKLFDTGVIEYHYAAMVSGSSSNYANGNSATVWLENTAGTAALVSSVNQPLVRPNTAIRFTP